ncbi:hypothetical protein [Mitsuaria sp. 7]|uniref:hypothetical protein n=1 Tax=Mitsuaria sp. 7 TaxID=1658665 RepID=UPI0007DDB7DC|nr:hypothetical protein [Mitsuaria sp. 7]ANH68664.1 hypothetical protein ABE85_15775 [Mitsuaria sp. 7]
MSAPMELPSPLHRWRDWLGWFDLALAESLGDLVRRLQDLAGPVQARSGRADTQPEGLGDLRSRGPYDRLLTTEWLLADELPEEFLRRAAASEHLFLAPALKAMPTDRAVVALFDAGPLQLGAPRLAHLAAWVLLARRAADLGGTLRWGIVQQPGALHGAARSADLARLMTSRTLTSASEVDRDAWRAVLSASGESHDDSGQPGQDLSDAEVWWIGAPTPDLAAPAGNERVLSFRLQWTSPQLDVAFAAPGATRRTTLPLPEEGLAARLMRADFKTPERSSSLQGARPKGTGKRAPPRGNAPPMALTHPPVFSRGGGSVLVPGVEGSHTALIFSIPSPASGRPVQRRTPQWAARATPIAFGLSGLSAHALIQCGELRLFQGWQVKRFVQRQLGETDVFVHVPGTARWMPMVSLHDGKESALLLVDSTKRLSFWPGQPGPRDAPLRAIGYEVIALAGVTSTSALAVYLAEGQVCLGWLGMASRQLSGIPMMPATKAADRALLALRPDRGRGQSPMPAALAARSQRTPVETWDLCWASPGMALISEAPFPDLSRATLRVPHGAKVIGLTTPHDEDSAALIVIGSDRRSVARMSSGAIRPLFSIAADIVQAEVCAETGRVAVLTRDRELIVMDGKDGQVLMVARDDMTDEQKEPTP